MPQLIAALVILSAIAGACGYLMGLCFGFAKDEYADARAHPLLALLTRRSNPLNNLLGAFGAWALFLYGIPQLVFLLLGITDVTAFGMSFGAQILFGYIGLEVGERNWKSVA